jgi:predicted ribosome quality control (RQC) complex YloA/Tae2 family protein
MTGNRPRAESPNPSGRPDVTPLLVQILSRELGRKLVSFRLSHISQSAPETVVLALYHPDHPLQHLVLTLLPLKPLFFLSVEKHQALATPPNFCRSLRKNLEYAQLAAVRTLPGERLILLDWKTPSGIFRLAFEGIPKYPNLILAGPDGLIVSALRYKNEVERPVLPQSPYRPPPQPLEKPNLWELDGEGLRALHGRAGAPPLGNWLKTGFRGADPELCAYLESFGPQAFTEWDHTRRDALEMDWGLFTLLPGPPPSLRLFPVPPGSPESRSFAYPSEALEALFRLESAHRDRLQSRVQLESGIAKALKHEKRILEKLRKDRSEAEKADQYQWWGELLMAQLHKIRLHQPEAVLEDLVRGTPLPLTIPLDPGITPLQNAQRYFKKAQKGSRGLAQVEKREGEIKARIAQLQAAQRSLPALQGPAEIRRAFRELFPAKQEAPAASAKPKPEKVPTPNLLRVKLGKAFELCAGTSAAANDYVTFQLAQPGDLWFHVRDLPGAHVILRRLQRGAEPGPDLILKAARTAAEHSKATPGTKVTVSYTEKKNVRKIPGAPPGMVTLTKEKSLVVDL